MSPQWRGGQGTPDLEDKAARIPAGFTVLGAAPKSNGFPLIIYISFRALPVWT